VNFLDRPAIHSTWYLNRPIRGITLHDTEGTSDLTTHESAGGWHWLIGRGGTIYRDCDEGEAAWHVLKTDRWRPSWMITAPDGGVSDANYCTIGIEIVSGETFRQQDLPYTDAQYAALRTLLADIYARRGPLPIVFHGDLQSDRSDPVRLDPARAGLERQGDREYRFTGDQPATIAVALAPDVLIGDEQFRPIGEAVFGAQAPFAPGTGLSDAWASELRAGRYRGRPLGGETDLAAAGGAKYQLFESGVAIWIPGRGVTWSPPQDLTDEQVRPIAQAVFGATAPFVPGTGIADSWLSELRAGRYRGQPLASETGLPAPNGAVYQLFQYGVATFVPGRGVSWTAFAGETAPVAADQPVTPDTSLLAPPRATLAQAQAYMLSQANGDYTPDDVREIVRLYFDTAEPVGLDPCLVVAQLVHETAFLSSFWSQVPRRNPAGIGVTGEPGAGLSFPNWPVAARAHTGRLLAYALARVQATATQQALIDEALTWRALPDERRGCAPTLRGLAGTWAADPAYAERLSAHANRLRGALVPQPTV
jgi:hypothetical protein